MAKYSISFEAYVMIDAHSIEKALQKASEKLKEQDIDGYEIVNIEREDY
jgi:N-formylglutamate amidohydrolase